MRRFDYEAHSFLFSVLTGDSGAAASSRENVKNFNHNFEQILYLLRHDFCRTGWVAVEASRGGSNEMFSEIVEELRKVWEEPLKWDSWELRGLGHWAPCGICFAYDYQVTDYPFHLAIFKKIYKNHIFSCTKPASIFCRGYLGICLPDSLAQIFTVTNLIWKHILN